MKFRIILRSPIVFEGGWKYRVIQFAKKGKSLAAVKEIRDAKGWPLIECKRYYDEIIRPKYYKPHSEL